LVGLVLFAGHETTTALIANAIVHLSEHPDLHRQMRANPALVRLYVEEVLRLDSPVQHIGRWATDDMNFDDTPIEAGDPIVLLPGAANRDDAAWRDADELKLIRSRTSPHIAFGWGRHYCLGAALARIEAELAVRALVNTYETFTLLETLEYRRPANVRCPSRLLLAWPG
jgi:cytochrome P450